MDNMLQYMKESTKPSLTLKELISRAKTNQRELSRKTGIPEVTINSWVAGKMIPRLDRALILARALEVSIKELCDAMGLNTRDIPDDSH